VRIFPQRGTTVAPLDIAGFREALFTRVALEVAVAAEAARRITPQQCEELGLEVQAQERAVAQGDDEAFFRLNEVFHRRLMAIAGVPNVWSAVDAVKVHLDRFRAGHLGLNDHYPLEPVVEEHAALIETLARGDGDAAAGQMRAHIDKVAPRAELLHAQRPELFTWPAGLIGPTRLRSLPNR